MSDKIRIDSHKLIYHPAEVAKYMEKGDIFPIEIEISPSGSCNHRCTFCAVDYIGYRSLFIQKEEFLNNIRIMRENGLKSIICSGEGEPLLCKELADIIYEIKLMGIDIAMSTNGVLLTNEFVEKALDKLTWIRFSVASLKDKSYEKIHRAKEGDLNKVIENISYAVEYKKKNNLNITLGVQCILIKENQEEIMDMALKLKTMGVDYFTVKPYSQHSQSNNKFSYDYEKLLYLQAELDLLQTESYKVYFRANSINAIMNEKNYSKCGGLCFMTHIDANGDVWPCINFIGKQEYCYGNIYKEKFDIIWNGKRRSLINERINSQDITTTCRQACRLDNINRYLDELENPSLHVNFI